MAHATSCGLTSVTLELTSADGARKHAHSTAADIMRAMEASMPAAGPMSGLPTGELGAAIQGRINEHEIVFGDTNKRPNVKPDNRALVDRSAAARQHVLVLGAIQQLSTQQQQQQQQAHHANNNTTGNTRANTHRSSRAAAKDGSSSACTTARRHGGGTTAPATARGGRRLQLQHHEGSGACTPGRSTAGGSAWTSFRGDSDLQLPASEEPSGSALDGGPEAAAHTHRTCDSAAVTARSSRNSRRQLNRQGSTGSLASRTSGGGGSVWGGSVVSRLSSSYGGGGGEASVVGGSSCSGRKSVKRKPPKPKPGRVAQAFAEFAGSDDWVSQTLLRHRLASIIQARWRGYAVRQRWRADREQLVEEERARLRAPEAQAERVQELRGKLAAFQQRKLLQAAAEAAEAAAGADGCADEDGGAEEDASGGEAWCDATASPQRRSQLGESSGGLSTWQSSRSHSSCEASQCRTPTSHQHGGGGGLVDARGSSSDGSGRCSSGSGCWSDAELEDVAAIKFCVTPPWERVEGAWDGGGGRRGVPLSQALRQRLLEAAGGDGCQAAAGGLPWECSSAQENSAKLDEARRRRICRRPEPVRLPAPAVAAAAAAGLLVGSGDASEQAAAPGDGDMGDEEQDAHEDAGEGSAGGSAPLPALVVEELLLQRYADKYAGRLGLPHKMPGRRRFLQLQAAAAARAEAASAACRNAAAAAGGEVDDGGGGLGADAAAADVLMSG